MPDLISPETFRALNAALATTVLEHLQKRHWTLAAAESCTGGMLLTTLTEIAGSSASVVGGVVCYSNQVKEEWVGVQAETLKQYGAVSEQTAYELAQGIRKRMNSTLGVGITGVAGPGGGSVDKPVGLVYIGLATPAGVAVQRCQWEQDRFGNRAASVEQALQLVLEFCVHDS